MRSYLSGNLGMAFFIIFYYGEIKKDIFAT